MSILFLCLGSVLWLWGSWILYQRRNEDVGYGGIGVITIIMLPLALCCAGLGYIAAAYFPSWVIANLSGSPLMVTLGIGCLGAFAGAMMSFLSILLPSVVVIFAATSTGCGLNWLWSTFCWLNQQAPKA